MRISDWSSDVCSSDLEITISEPSESQQLSSEKAFCPVTVHDDLSRRLTFLRIHRQRPFGSAARDLQSERRCQGNQQIDNILVWQADQRLLVFVSRLDICSRHCDQRPA